MKAQPGKTLRFTELVRQIEERVLPPLYTSFEEKTPFRISAATSDGFGFPEHELILQWHDNSHPDVYATNAIQDQGDQRFRGCIFLNPDIALGDRPEVAGTVIRHQLVEVVDFFWNSASTIERRDKRSKDTPETRFFVPRDVQMGIVALAIEEVNKELLAYLNENPEYLYRLEPRAFEELIAELFRKEGFDVTVTQQSRDGGIDIVAKHQGLLGDTQLIIECKRYAPDNKVGLAIVQRLHGVKNAMRATKGIVVTTSFFTQPAIDFAEPVKYELGLLDYFDICNLLAKHGDVA